MESAREAAADDGTPASRRARWLCYALLVAGAILRLVQYAANTSQWTDEAQLSTSIINRPLGRLIGTYLDFGQTAPPGFLAVEKLVTMALGPSDAALRLFPFLMSLAALGLFYRLCTRVLRGPAVPVALAFVAFAAPLIAYAAQVKQYSSDVATALAVLVVASGLYVRRGGRRVALALVVVAVAPWLAQSAVLVVAATSAVLLWSTFLGRAARAPLGRAAALGVVACWLASAVGAFVVSSAALSPYHRDYLLRFWADGFPPLHPLGVETLLWPGKALARPFGRVGPAGLFWPLPKLYLALMAIGVVALVRRRSPLAALVLAPVGVTLAAACAHQYPFADRLVLFLVPSLLLAVAEGLAVLVAFAVARAGAAADALSVVALSVVTLPALYPVVASPPPYKVEDLKPVMEYVAAQKATSGHAEDRVFVYYGAKAAFSYYAARFGWAPADYSLAPCHRGNARAYLFDLERLGAGHRMWLVMAHAIPYYDDHETIESYLGARAVAIDQRVAPSRLPAGAGHPDTAFARLYDFTQRPVGVVTPDRFPIAHDPPLDPRFGCD